MSTRNEPSTEIRAAIADLAERWEEQSRALYWLFRDLGGDPDRLLGESPFADRSASTGERERSRRRRAIASRPLGGLAV